MLGQEEGREAVIRQQLAKIARANPNAVPLYIIVSSGKGEKEEAVDQPITLCSRDSIVRDLLVSLSKKYPQFQHIYFFGKEKVRGRMDGVKKRVGDDGEKIIAVEQTMMERRVQDIHEMYRDDHGLLVVIVSERALIAKPKQSIEPILLVLTLLFAAVFLYLSFTEEQPPSTSQVRAGSEFDYIV